MTAVEATKELEVVITSSFFFKFSDFIAISNAAVPLETATEYFLLIFLENFFSKDFVVDKKSLRLLFFVVYLF